MIEQVNSIEQIEYIETVASFYIPEPSLIDPIEQIPATEEQIEQVKNQRFDTYFSEHACIFKDRYNSNAFTKRFTYEDYIKDNDIQKLIQHLELDVDKFWLLILFAYDYCTDRFRQGQTMKLSPLKQLQQLLETIALAGNNNMFLILKVGKQKMEIDSTDAIRFIAKAISNVQVDIKELKRMNRAEKAEKSIVLNNSPLIAYFANMFLLFFDTQENIANKRKKGAKHSKKEMALVSKLIYFTELSYNERLKDIEDEYLKAFLKQYKNYKYPNNTNKIYPLYYF